MKIIKFYATSSNPKNHMLINIILKLIIQKNYKISYTILIILLYTIVTGETI